MSDFRIAITLVLASSSQFVLDHDFTVTIKGTPHDRNAPGICGQ